MLERPELIDYGNFEQKNYPIIDLCEGGMKFLHNNPRTYMITKKGGLYIVEFNDGEQYNLLGKILRIDDAENDKGVVVGFMGNLIPRTKMLDEQRRLLKKGYADYLKK